MHKALLKDSVVYGLANAVQKLGPFVIVPLVIKVLGQKAYTTYDVSFVSAYLFSWLVVLGQDVAASILYFDERKTGFDKANVIASSLLLQLLFLLLLALLLGPFVNGIANALFAKDKAVADWWPKALWLLPGQVLYYQALNVLLWQKQKASYVWLCAVHTAFSIGSAAVSLLLLHGGIASLFYSLVCSVNAAGLVGLYLIRRPVFRSLLPVNKSLLKKLVGLGLPFALTAFFQQLLPAVDRFFLLEYNYGDALAPYLLASKLGTLVNFITSAFGLAFTPYALAKLNEEAAEEEIGSLFRFVSVTAFLALPFLLLFKDVLIAVFADASYREATKLLPFFFFGWVFDLFGYFTVLGIYRSHKTHLSLLLFAIGAAVVSLLNLLFIPLLGLYGAALSFCAGKAVLFFLSLFWLKKYFPLHLHPASFTAALLLSAMCCSLAYVLPWWMNILLLGLLLCAIVLYWRKKSGPAFLGLEGITNRRTRNLK